MDLQGHGNRLHALSYRRAPVRTGVRLRTLPRPIGYGLHRLRFLTRSHPVPVERPSRSPGMQAVPHPPHGPRPTSRRSPSNAGTRRCRPRLAVHGAGDGVRLVSQGRPPRATRQPVRVLSRDPVIQRAEVHPRQDAGGFLQRPARDARVLRVSQARVRELPGGPGHRGPFRRGRRRVCDLPSVQGCAPRRARAGMRALPYHRPVAFRFTRLPQGRAVSAGGRHLTVACASCHLDGVTRGTPTKCYDCHWVRRQDDPYQTRLGTQCESVSSAGQLDGGELEPRGADWPAPQRQAPVAWLRLLPQGPPVHGRHRRLFHLSHGATTRRRRSRTMPRPASRSIAKSAISRRTPPGRRRGSRTRPSHWSASTPPRRAPLATGTTSTRAPRATASAATPPITRRPRPRITRQPGSRRLRAVPPGDGLVMAAPGRSITPASSRWSGRTPRRRARRATRTASTRARRATASAATPPTTRRPRARNHAAAGFPTTCEQCHQPTALVVGHRVVQPRQRLPAGRDARHAGVRGVPQERRLQGHARATASAATRRLPEDHEPEPRGSRVPDHLRAVPPGDAPRRGAPASFNHASRLPAGRDARHAGVRGVPQERRLQGHARATASAATSPTTRRRRTRITRQPGSRRPASSATRQTARRGAPASFNHASRLPAGRDARHAGVRGVPQERRLQGHAARLRRLPPADYQKTTNPNHAAAGFPTTCEQCHQATALVVEHRRRSTTPASSRWSGRTPRRRARRATRTASTRARRATASAATRRLPEDDEPEPRGGRVPDHLRAVPPGLVTATGARASITTSSSRCSAVISSSRVRRATRTTSTRAPRLPACRATSRSTSRRRTRTTSPPASPRRASRVTRPATRRGTRESSRIPGSRSHRGGTRAFACSTCHTIRRTRSRSSRA